MHEGGVGKGVNAEHGEVFSLGEDGHKRLGNDAVGEFEVACFAFEGGNLGGGIDIANLRLNGLAFARCPVALVDARDGTARIQKEVEGLVARGDGHHEATIRIALAGEGDEGTLFGRLNASVEVVVGKVKGEGKVVEHVHADNPVKGFGHHAAHAGEVYDEQGMLWGFARANLQRAEQHLGALGGVASKIHLAGVEPLHALEFFRRTQMQHGVRRAGVQHHANGLAIDEPRDHNLFTTRILRHRHQLFGGGRRGCFGGGGGICCARRGGRGDREGEEYKKGGVKRFHAKMVAH